MKAWIAIKSKGPTPSMTLTSKNNLTIENLLQEAWMAIGTKLEYNEIKIQAKE